MGLREYEVVRNIRGKRIRVYAGHSLHRGHSAWKWKSGTTTGFTVRPYCCRVFGIQWRPSNEGPWGMCDNTRHPPYAHLHYPDCTRWVVCSYNDERPLDWRPSDGA